MRAPWTPDARPRLVAVVVALVALATGGLVGAYLAWLWWEIGTRPLVPILGIAAVILGGVVALIARRHGSLIGLAILAVGSGILVGQHLGPSREPLISQPGGAMTLRLESPVVAVVTGSADCLNVASESEFSVQGELDQTAGGLGSPIGISIQSGDRFSYPRDTARTDDVRLEIEVITSLVPGSVKVQDKVGMEATESSALESTFSNVGGSIRFSDLQARDGEGYSGASVDLVGTVEWTCGAPVR